MKQILDETWSPLSLNTNAIFIIWWENEQHSLVVWKQADSPKWQEAKK